jgi:molecular chaperone Hsp33
MTSLSQIAWDDTVLPFQLDRPDIRGRVARLDGVLEKILSQHDYPGAVEALVAEATLLTALIGPTIKLRWKLSLQIRGDGPIRIIATDYFAPESEGAPGLIRAWASFDPARLDPDARPFQQIGKGYFALLIDQGAGTVPYQGITPLAGGSLAACAETYFAQSEQLPTRFALSFGRSRLAGRQEGWRGGGIMLQHMPKASPLMAGEGGSGEGGLLSALDVLDGDDGENWSRANVLLDTVEDLELIGPQVAPTDLLLRLFHEEAPRVYDTQAVAFGCTCSDVKVRQSLSIYSAKDIATMTTDQGTVTADCQFCGRHYVFDPLSLGFEASVTAEGQPILPPNDPEDEPGDNPEELPDDAPSEDPVADPDLMPEDLPLEIPDGGFPEIPDDQPGQV